MEVMEDQNLFMLMSHSKNGVLSNASEEYFQIRQEEELQKLKDRRAAECALRIDPRPSPSPILVETSEELQRRVAAAHNYTQNRSTRSLQEDDGLLMRGSQTHFEHDLEEQDACAAATNDAINGQEDKDEEQDLEIALFSSRQQGIQTQVNDFLSTGRALRSRQGHGEQLEEAREHSNAHSSIAATFQQSRREIWNDTKEEEEVEICVKGISMEVKDLKVMTMTSHRCAMALAVHALI